MADSAFPLLTAKMTSFMMDGPVPSLTLSAAAATSGATVVLTPGSNNLIGEISFKTNLSLSTGGDLFTLTLGGGFSYPTYIRCLYGPSNMNFASQYNNIAPKTNSGSGNNAVSLTAGAALTGNTVFTGIYFIFGC